MTSMMMKIPFSNACDIDHNIKKYLYYFICPLRMKAQELERRCGVALATGAPERQLGHNPRRHIHRRELLKQQLTRIWNLDQRKIRAIVACFT
jgi:hypothetical protein